MLSISNNLQRQNRTAIFPDTHVTEVVRSLTRNFYFRSQVKSDTSIFYFRAISFAKYTDVRSFELLFTVIHSYRI